MIRTTLKEIMLRVFNTAASTERRVSQVLGEYVIVKRAAFSSQACVQYLDATLSDIIEVRYLGVGLIQLIFKGSNG